MPLFYPLRSPFPSLRRRCVCLLSSAALPNIALVEAFPDVFFLEGSHSSHSRRRCFSYCYAKPAQSDTSRSLRRRVSFRQERWLSCCDGSVWRSMEVQKAPSLLWKKAAVLKTPAPSPPSVPRFPYRSDIVRSAFLQNSQKSQKKGWRFTALIRWRLDNILPASLTNQDDT